MSEAPIYRFDGEDNGFCRVYYKRERRLFCWQEDRPGVFTFYVCSRDGEPSHEVEPVAMSFELPLGETKIGQAVKTFLKAEAS